MRQLTSVETDFIDATIDGDSSRLESAARELGDSHVVTMVNAIFLCAVWDWFPEDPSAQVIADAARSVVDAAAGADLQPVVLEGVLRLAFGDEDAVASIDAQAAYRARIFVTTYYFSRNSVDPKQRLKFKTQIADALGQ